MVLHSFGSFDFPVMALCARGQRPVRKDDTDGVVHGDVERALLNKIPSPASASIFGVPRVSGLIHEMVSARSVSITINITCFGELANRTAGLPGPAFGFLKLLVYTITNVTIVKIIPIQSPIRCRYFFHVFCRIRFRRFTIAELMINAITNEAITRAGNLRSERKWPNFICLWMR